MHTWRTLMSAAPQGAFVVIPEISLCDISYAIKNLSSYAHAYGGIFFVGFEKFSCTIE